jgi:hypothetical protein
MNYYFYMMLAITYFIEVFIDFEYTGEVNRMRFICSLAYFMLAIFNFLGQH